MSVAATILLGLASFAAAQTSSYKDPLTGEPIPLVKRSDIRMPRRKIQAACPESIDEQNDSYYHPTLDPDKGATCTNSDDYPMIWKEIPMGSNIPQYISSTAQECCQKFYERQGVPAGTCRIEDVCNPLEIILGSWHSSKYNPTTCTNSGDYPVSWKDETLRQYHLFETSAKCCAEVEKKTGQTCDVLDVEAEWSCDKWHLAIEKDENDFAIHPDGTCTNSGIIYDVWMAKQDVYVFPNHQACCDNFMIAYDDCHKVDECTAVTTTTSSPPSSSPTRNPTNLPTHSPSDSPTRIPTNLPTHSPSDSPTKNPTNLPTHLPSSSPTRNPTNLPTHLPSDSPTRNPTNLPTHLPSSSPTKRPSDKPVEDVICGKVWEPVCGEDGVSYSNDCEANKVDVKVAHEGKCEDPAETCSPGGKCSVEGSSCSVGTETCCGQTYDSLKCECSKGLWLCLVTEACMLPCSPTFAPTTVTRQPTPLPSKDPTNTPTMRPVDATTTTTTVAATTTTSGEMVTHSSGLCGKWHVSRSREAPSTCTNSGVGMTEPTSDCLDWYRSGEDCCNLFFGREDCPKVDVTVTTTKATTTTTAATTRSCGEWHVSRVNMKTCTNSREGMREPGPDCAEWYASGEECCFSYLRGAECQIINVSVDTTSTEATLPLSPCDEWHPNPSDSTKCTNSDVYPSVWREYYYDRFFFRTAEACCEQQGSRCSVVDVCTFCTEEYSPVCGSDGSTYGNKCKAEAAGINLYVTGTCDEVVAATTTTTTSTTTTPATATTTTPETTTTTPATTTTTTTPATTTTTTTTTPATTTTTTNPATTPVTTTTTTTPATNTTTSTTSATTTSNPGDMEENSGTLGTTTTTTPATTTTTTTPATTTTTTTTTSTTPVATTTSTTSTTTTSNPGDMEENSGTLGTTTTTTPTDATCSLYRNRKQCKNHKKDGCDWDGTTRVCRHEDEEEMEPNSDSAADDDVCASLSKRRSKCQKQGCVWSRSKTNKENRCQSSSGQSPSNNLASKSSKKGSKSK